MKIKCLSAAVGFLCLIGCKNHDSSLQPGRDWPTYGGNKAGNRYSPLKQITLENVKNLKVAWMYNAAEPPDPNNPNQRPKAIQCQPIVVNGVLYGTTPELNLFALDASTGKQLWKFAPPKDKKKYNIINTNRGVMYWESGSDKRILYSAGSALYAVNAINGKLVKSFGRKGKVDLHEGLGEGLDHDVNTLSIAATTPGVIYKNILVMGSSVSEGGDAAPGHVRGFDVVTGKLKWIFHTIPQPGEFGYDTWPEKAYKKFGGANSWGGMALDEKRGMVYFGTGSPSSDYYGGDRAGMNLFGNCIVALNAETGKLNWYYQTIHHDLWDRDMPCPPNLTTVKHNGKLVDVVVQVTKDGLVYVLDRDKGTSLFPVEERPVPTQGLPGEHPWPTQKFPLKPAPLCRQVFTEADITDISQEAHKYIKKRYLQLRSDHKFTPPSTTGTLLLGYSGGAEWGGNAIDTDGILYQNSNEDPWELTMVDVEKREKEMASLSKGNALYVANCAACHGMDRKGSGSVIPDILTIGKRRSAEEIMSIIKTGSGRMPSFQHISEQERHAIVGFLLNKEVKPSGTVDAHAEPAVMVTKKKGNVPYEPKYVIKSWRKLTDQDGYPGVKPPWGTLNAIDLNSGEYKWRVPLGEYPELAKKGIPTTGTESYGGPVATAGGLIFIAGTRDEKIRAFDKTTGKVVWEYQLPAGGYATPITYEAAGKQYVVIAAGGGRGGKPGGYYVAFSF
jgi:quinoprotein glucose dehydrogenase